MNVLCLLLDSTLTDRIEALALLQREALPGLPYDAEDAARQALARGLDLMLAEFLSGRSGTARHEDEKAVEA